MTTTKPRTCKYQLGQAVEVEVVDFSTPGMPRVWVAGTVSATRVLNEARGLWDLTVLRVDGALSMQVVGPRGGNKNIRAMA